MLICQITSPWLSDDWYWLLQSKSVGQVLFDSVVSKLQLLESDYFGLEYTGDESMPVSCGAIACYLW